MEQERASAINASLDRHLLGLLVWLAMMGVISAQEQDTMSALNARETFSFLMEINASQNATLL